MNDLAIAVLTERKRDLIATIALSIMFTLAIGYLVFMWGGYPNFSALGIWGMLFMQTLSAFLLVGPSLHTNRWPWWKIGWTVTLLCWSIGVIIGLIARYITS